MLICHTDIKVGDEFIISSRHSKSLLYCKCLGIPKDKRKTWVVSTGPYHHCWHTNPTKDSWYSCQPDVSKHNKKVYFKLQYYACIWLVKRD